MTKKMLQNFLFIGLCAFPALAQTASLAGPVSGVVYDVKSRSLRAMAGLPGASYLTASLVSDLDQAAVSPDGGVAIAVGGGAVQWIRGLRALSPEAAVIENAIESPENFAWNADASAVAVYSSRAGAAQIIRDGAVKSLLDVSGLTGRVVSMLLDRSGDNLVLAFDSGVVYAVSASSQPRKIAQAENPDALLFSSGERDLLIADRGGHQVLEVRDYQGAATVAPFVGSLDAPVALAATSEDGLLFVADAGSKELKIYNVTSRSVVETIALDFAPSRLEPFGRAHLFVMNTGAGEPLYVLDAGPARSVTFVPNGREN